MSNFSSNSGVEACLSALRSGAVIAYPTEGVWGLGCDPQNPDAVNKILNLKQRHVSKGLILIGSSDLHFDSLLDGLAQDVQKKIRASAGQHITWLVPHRGLILPCVHGDSDKVAIRISTHPIVKALCEGFGSAIVSTSANPAGAESARDRSEVERYFSGEPRVIAPGEVGGLKKASTIIDAETGTILRA